MNLRYVQTGQGLACFPYVWRHAERQSEQMRILAETAREAGFDQIGGQYDAAAARIAGEAIRRTFNGGPL